MTEIIRMLPDPNTGEEVPWSFTFNPLTRTYVGRRKRERNEDQPAWEDLVETDEEDDKEVVDEDDKEVVDEDDKEVVDEDDDEVDEEEEVLKPPQPQLQQLPSETLDFKGMLQSMAKVQDSKLDEFYRISNSDLMLLQKALKDKNSQLMPCIFCFRDGRCGNPTHTRNGRPNPNITHDVHKMAKVFGITL